MAAGTRFAAHATSIACALALSCSATGSRAKAAAVARSRSSKSAIYSQFAQSCTRDTVNYHEPRTWHHELGTTNSHTKRRETVVKGAAAQTAVYKFVERAH